MALAGNGLSGYIFSIGVFLITQIFLFTPLESGNYVIPSATLGLLFGGMFVLVISYFLFRTAFSLLDGQMTLRQFDTNGAVENFLNILRFRSAIECLRFLKVAGRTMAHEMRLTFVFALSSCAFMTFIVLVLLSSTHGWFAPFIVAGISDMILFSSFLVIRSLDSSEFTRNF